MERYDTCPIGFQGPGVALHPYGRYFGAPVFIHAILVVIRGQMTQI